MFNIFKRRNKPVDALMVKMMEDGAFKEVMTIKAKTVIDDTVLLMYMERNISDNIDAVKWYLDLLYPVSNKIVKYVLDNRILSLIPNVYTSYCEHKMKRMNFTEDEYMEIIKKFKGFNHIPPMILNKYIDLLVELNPSRTRYYLQDKLIYDLLSHKDTMEQMMNILPYFTPLTEAYVCRYIINGGSNIAIFNHIDITPYMFTEFCKNNKDIYLDLSILDSDQIYAYMKEYVIGKTLKERMDISKTIDILLISNIENIKYIPDQILRDKHSIIQNKCTITSLDNIPCDYMTYDVLYNFLKNGGYIDSIPKNKRATLDLNLYKTAIIGTIINIDYTPQYIIDELTKDITLIDILFKTEEFMVSHNSELIDTMYGNIIKLDSSYNLHKKYPLLFRVYRDSTLGRTSIQQLIYDNPVIIQYVPEYLLTYPAVNYCAIKGTIPLNQFNLSSIKIEDIYELVKYNLDNILLLDNKILDRLIYNYWESISTRFIEIIK